MKKKVLALLFLVAGWQATQAQNMSMYKALNDSAYQTTADYQAGNKYQKDAILFMDMVADTHPYYIKPERRAELIADLKERTGLDVLDVEIGHVDFLRDVAYINVTYTLEKGKVHNSIDQVVKFKS